MICVSHDWLLVYSPHTLTTLRYPHTTPFHPLVRSVSNVLRRGTSGETVRRKPRKSAITARSRGTSLATARTRGRPRPARGGTGAAGARVVKGVKAERGVKEAKAGRVGNCGRRATAGGGAKEAEVGARVGARAGARAGAGAKEDTRELVSGTRRKAKGDARCEHARYGKRSQSKTGLCCGKTKYGMQLCFVYYYFCCVPCGCAHVSTVRLWVVVCRLWVSRVSLRQVLCGCVVVAVQSVQRFCGDTSCGSTRHW